MSARATLRAALAAAALGTISFFGASAGAVNVCGNETHQNDCGGKGDIYPCCPNGGNCTWWAWESVCRNWHVGLVNWGNADTWAGHAKVDPSYDVLGTPVPGSVATRDLGAFGHVAWVTAVNGGTITVTEEGCCSTCWYGMRTHSYAASYFDSGFVVPHGSECGCNDGDTQTESCGGCGTHTRTCHSCAWGDWGTCSGPAELCDGIDNNCNGLVDEGHPQAFGPTLPDHAATVVDVSYPQVLHAGERGLAWVDFRNVGAKEWPKDGLWLSARGAPEGGASALFSAEAWPAWDVAAVLDAPVLPGDVGRFSFAITAPATPGAVITETFQLKVPGGGFIACPTADITPSIQVLPGAGGAGGAGGMPAAPSASLAPHGCSLAPSGVGPSSLAPLALALLFLSRARRHDGAATGPKPRRDLRAPRRRATR